MTSEERKLEAPLDQLDLLTFTRLMKTFALYPEGIQDCDLKSVYEKMNQSLIPNPKRCVRILLNEGYVVKKFVYGSGVSVLIPSQRARILIDHLMKTMNPERSLRPSAPTPKHRVPLLPVPKEIREKKSCSILIQNIMNPQEMYFQIQGEEHSEALDLLSQKMDTFYLTNPERKGLALPDVHSISNPDIVAAPFENGYYRALVLDNMSSDRLKVFFIDYGNRDTVNVKDVFFLKDEFLQLPCQAIQGHALHLNDNGKLNAAAVNKINKLRRIRAEFLHEFEATDLHWPLHIKIELYDEESGKSLQETIATVIKPIPKERRGK